MRKISMPMQALKNDKIVALLFTMLTAVTIFIFLPIRRSLSGLSTDITISWAGISTPYLFCQLFSVRIKIFCVDRHLYFFLITSVFWFPKPKKIDSGIINFLNFEKIYLTDSWTIEKSWYWLPPQYFFYNNCLCFGKKVENGTLCHCRKGDTQSASQLCIRQRKRFIDRKTGHIRVYFLYYKDILVFQNKKEQLNTVKIKRLKHIGLFDKIRSTSKLLKAIRRCRRFLDDLIRLMKVTFFLMENQKR